MKKFPYTEYKPNGTIEHKVITADGLKKLEFDNIKEFNIFVKMHPSCYYCDKYINEKNKIAAIFALYKHTVAQYDNDTRHYIRGESISYNSNPVDDNELAEYYEIKRKLERYKELTAKYEQGV